MPALLVQASDHWTAVEPRMLLPAIDGEVGLLAWTMESSSKGIWRVYDLTNGKPLVVGAYGPGTEHINQKLPVVREAVAIELQVIGAAVSVTWRIG